MNHQPKVTAAQFRILLSAVSDCCVAAASCTARELEDEALRLRVATTELCNAKLARSSERLIAARRSMMDRSVEVLNRRVRREAA